MGNKIVRNKYPSKSAKKSKLFQRARREFKSIIRDPGKEEIQTSFSMPKPMFKKLEEAREKLDKKGIIMVLTNFWLLVVLKVMLKNGKRKECQIARPKRQNPSKCPSRKLSVTWSLTEYNLFHLKASHLKVCVSYLIYLALCFYLDKVVDKLLKSSKEETLLWVSRFETISR